MGTWHGILRNKCIRCFKPQAQNATSQRYKTWLAEISYGSSSNRLTTLSSSCGLGFRWIEPDIVPFELQDLTTGLGPDQYRDYRLKSRSREQTVGSARSLLEQESPSASRESYDTPPVDFVCQRLTIKWEPIFNITHRYLHCRCVIWLSTHSRLYNETTLWIYAICPRHNNKASITWIMEISTTIRTHTSTDLGATIRFGPSFTPAH